jgi:Domain of unknown function (DUF5668)
MRVNRGLLGWGVFFIVLGAVVLAVRQGLVAEELVAEAWRLWPVLLVVGGIGLVLRRTPIEPLADLVVAATFGLILGGFLASGSFPFASCGDDEASRAFDRRTGELGSAAAVELEMACGDLTIRTTDGNGWALEGVDEDGGGPTVEADADTLAIDTGRDVAVTFGAKERWTVTLPTGSRLDVDAQVNAGVADLDLTDAELGTLHLGVNAGEARIDLSGVAALEELELEFNAVGDPRIRLPARSLTGSIEANATGEVRICAPAEAGIRLTVDDNITASNNYAERGLVRNGDAWETQDYADRDVRIDLRTEVNAGSFELADEEACDA